MGVSIQEINQMGIAEFISTLGRVFEDSPWIAKKAWAGAPFYSKDHLLETMITVVQESEKPLQLQLLRAHPDLGTKFKMSIASAKEQQEAGLNTLSEQEFESFSVLNRMYADKFGFPFIMAVKGQKKLTILAALKERINFSNETEFEHALKEVVKIASFRLNEMIL